MNFLFIVPIILLQSNLIFAQSIPNDNFLYLSRKLLHDAGMDWNSLTVFGPVRFKLEPQKKLKKSNLSNHFVGQVGFDAGNEYFSIYGYGHFKHNNHYYVYFSPTLVKETRKIYNSELRRTSLIKDQYDQSGIGFENSWATLQIGRGRESWGSGNDIQLALSEKSSTYDYLLLASDYGNIRVRFIYGFLENVNTNINRYITARGFEWTNKKSLVIGFSETVIYSGGNRSFDIGYLNPISSHLEIELNNRLNVFGERNSNAVWQAHLDYLMMKNLRISFNYLLDEFVLDQDIEIGKEHGRAYSIRLAYTPIFSNNHLITIFSSIVNVGTPTFRHGIGTNNFVQKGRPLGWYRGSDGQEICIGMKYFNNNNFYSNITTGLLVIGEETISDRVFEPYSDYLKSPFPSGNVKEIAYVETDFNFWWKKNYSISSSFFWSLDRNIIDISLIVPI